jgi:hypothetical protein
MGVKMGPSRRVRYDLCGPGSGVRQSPRQNLSSARGDESDITNLNNHTLPTGRIAFSTSFQAVPARLRSSVPTGQSTKPLNDPTLKPEEPRRRAWSALGAAAFLDLFKSLIRFFNPKRMILVKPGFGEDFIAESQEQTHLNRIMSVRR